MARIQEAADPRTGMARPEFRTVMTGDRRPAIAPAVRASRRRFAERRESLESTKVKCVPAGEKWVWNLGKDRPGIAARGADRPLIYSFAVAGRTATCPPMG